MKTREVAKAFVEGRKAQCHNAMTDGSSYWLHGNRIAYKEGNTVYGDWCGWYTQTTSRHLNHIADVLAVPRVSSRNAVDGFFVMKEY